MELTKYFIVRTEDSHAVAVETKIKGGNT